MLTTNELIITITTMSLITLLTRAIPFIVFPPKKETPKYILHLGEILPFAIIGMLIVYCLKNISILAYPFAIPEIISIAFITIVHLWKNNTLLSILGGTILYMFLVQVVFV